MQQMLFQLSASCPNKTEMTHTVPNSNNAGFNMVSPKDANRMAMKEEIYQLEVKVNLLERQRDVREKVAHGTATYTARKGRLVRKYRVTSSYVLI